MLIQPDLSTQSVMLAKSGPPKEMLSVSKLPDGRTKVRVNSSSLGIMQECWRKAQLALDQTWKASVEGPATLFGSAMHKALEIYYSETKRPKMTSAIAAEMEMIGFNPEHQYDQENLLLRATAGFVKKAQPLAQLPDTDKRSIANGVWTLSHYFRDFCEDPLVVYVDKQGPFTERVFTMPLREGETLVVEYFGTIDLVLRNEITGQLFVTDHKTSSIIGADFYNRLKPNHQYTGYLLAANRVFGVQTDSFLVNCLQVKERPKTARGSNPNFVRQVTQRDENDFKEFTDAVWNAAWEYLKCRDSNVWPLGHVNACAMYQGCQYLSVCSAPKQLRDSVLRAKFQQVGV